MWQHYNVYHACAYLTHCNVAMRSLNMPHCNLTTLQCFIMRLKSTSRITWPNQYRASQSKSWSMVFRFALKKPASKCKAPVKWFDLESLKEVKSESEIVHLLCGVPRYFCSRQFKELWLKSKVRQMKSKAQIVAAESKQVSIAALSSAEVYVLRSTWDVPPLNALVNVHVATKRVFRQ